MLIRGYLGTMASLIASLSAEERKAHNDPYAIRQRHAQLGYGDPGRPRCWGCCLEWTVTFLKMAKRIFFHFLAPPHNPLFFSFRFGWVWPCWWIAQPSWGHSLQKGKKTGAGFCTWSING